jgi:hypothetical protein
MKRGILIATALGAGVLTGALLPYGPAGSAHAASPLAALALKRSDVPSGYAQTRSQTQTIQQAALDAKVSVATLRSKGWLGSYSATFAKTGKASTIEVESGIDHFKSATGTSWDLTHGVQLIKAQYPHATTFSPSGIGNQALGLKGSTTSGKTTVSFVFVVFRRGGYLGLAGIAALGSVPSSATSDSVRYARLMDSRVKNA